MIVTTPKGAYARSSTITHDCKCNEYKAKKRSFQDGQKKCSNCEIFIIYDGNRCPCCEQRLRTKSRSYMREGLVRI